MTFDQMFGMPIHLDTVEQKFRGQDHNVIVHGHKRNKCSATAEIADRGVSGS